MDKHCAGFIKELLGGGVLCNLEVEALRGCQPFIHRHRVRLEPAYREFRASQTYADSKSVKLSEPLTRQSENHVFHLLFPLPETVPWEVVEQAVACLSGFFEPFSFEIVGNASGISYYLVLTKPGLAFPVRSVLQKFEPDVEVVEAEADPLACFAMLPYERVSVFEFCVEPPYYHQLCDYRGRSASPLTSLLKVLSGIPEDGVGAYQVLFQAARQPWENNIKTALEAEAFLRQSGSHCRTAPKELKNFFRKPFFAVRPRLVCAADSGPVRDAVKTFIGEFQVEGKKVFFKSKADLDKAVSKKDVLEMAGRRVSYMTGMLLTSSELAGFFHFPDESVKRFSLPVRHLDGFKVPDSLKQGGIPVGTDSAGLSTIHVPASAMNFNTYRLGRSTTGKTTSMVSQVLYHVEEGHGVAVFDPHDNLIPQILCSERLSSHHERVCYFDPCDPDYVLDYNPFHIADAEDAGRLTADYADSSKSLFSSSWGYRMAHILSMAYYALFSLGENLSSLPALFSRSTAGGRLRRKVISRVTNQEVRRFYEHEVLSYPQEAFLPVINKITTLLMDNKLSRVFSRKHNKVDVNKMLNEGGVLLVSLPIGLLGAEISAQLGGMLLAQLQKAAFHRTSIPQKERVPFFIFVDECYRFNAFNIYEGIINECRKFGVFVNLAHQDTGQLPESSLKAFLSMNNIFVFGVNIEDAKRVSRAFDNKVKPEEFTSLRVGEFMARIGNEVVKVKSFPPAEEKDSEETRSLIIENSRRLYYTKMAEMKEQEDKQKERFYDSF